MGDHLLRDRAPVADISVYSEDIFQLFHSATKEEYEEKLRERQHTWDATFEAYYNGVWPRETTSERGVAKRDYLEPSLSDPSFLPEEVGS